MELGRGSPGPHGPIRSYRGAPATKTTRVKPTGCCKMVGPWGEQQRWVLLLFSLKRGGFTLMLAALQSSIS